MTKVREVMQADVISIDAQSPLWEAAQVMRTNDIGDVFITEGTLLAGILTDRDIAIRAVAARADVTTPAVEYCSEDLVSVSPEHTLEEAAEILRESAVRRIPVIEDGNLVGVISASDITAAGIGADLISDIVNSPSSETVLI